MSQLAPLKDRLDRIIAIMERIESNLGLHSESAPTIIEHPQAMEASTITPSAAGELPDAENVPKRRGRPPLRRD